MIKKIILWILTLSCAGTIFYFSSQEAVKSSKVSSEFITTVVKTLDFKDTLTEKEIEKISVDLTFIVRKSAHFCIYALLGLLIALLYHEYELYGKQLFLKATVTSFLYAVSDEFHQHFVKGRSGEIRDVCLDTLGAICGAAFVAICVFYHMKYRERNEKNEL